VQRNQACVMKTKANNQITENMCLRRQRKSVKQVLIKQTLVNHKNVWGILQNRRRHVIHSGVIF